MEAMKELVKDGVSLDRTVHVVFMPDEEVGGVLGMKLFVEKGKFKEMNPAIVLDEGLASENEVFNAYYGERTPLWIKLTSNGNAGHASRLPEGTAMERMLKVLNRLYVLREEESQRLLSGKAEDGDVTSVNCTIIQGGWSPTGEMAVNLIPSSVEAHVDMRVAVDRDLLSFRDEVRQWAAQYGVDMEVTFGPEEHSVTSLDNEWWHAFRNGANEKAGIDVQPLVFPAATDSKYIRRTGVPSIGFSPISHTKVELHCVNESLHRDVFLRGIDIYKNIVTYLANYNSSSDDVTTSEEGRG